MSIFDCFFKKFKCEEEVIAAEKKCRKAKSVAVNDRTQTRRWITNLKREDNNLKKELWDAEHYSFMYEDLPDPHEIKESRTIDIRSVVRKQFGESPTQYVTSNPSKIEYNTTGLANWRIPKNTIEQLLVKHPIKLYNETEGYTDNSVLRFFAEINMSLYWNCAIFDIKTKTRWVVAFWPKDEDIILYADPITKRIWVPIPSKAEDNPEVVLL